MKKIFSAVFALMVGAAAMANNANIETKEIDFTFEVKPIAVSRELGLSETQTDQMDYILNRFRNDLNKVKNAKEDEKRVQRMHEAINYNLSAAHSCLTGEQYHKYLILLNTTLNNKGLDTIIFQNILAIED